MLTFFVTPIEVTYMDDSGVEKQSFQCYKQLSDQSFVIDNDEKYKNPPLNIVAKYSGYLHLACYIFM